MSTKLTKAQIAERDDAIKELRKIVKPGATLRTILRHTSRSGMSRSISVVTSSKRGEVRHLDYLIARALGDKIDPIHDGIKIGGCGMDMGFALVYNLSVTLYGGRRGYACLGDRCPSNSHTNDRCAPRGKGVRHNDGYAISQRWL